MERLLPALDGLAPSYLVGGAVRDLLRGADAVDLDVAVDGDARSVARALAERLGGTAREHERFRTATVRADDLSVDLATTRRESYPEPGVLPLVEEAGLGDDLARRDFTINAMALGLSGDDLGHLYDPREGLTDLDEGVVRVLHDGRFRDDPTRLLRAASAAPEIVRTLREREHVPSELLGLLGGEPPETLALALALGAPPEPRSPRTRCRRSPAPAFATS